MPASLKPQFIYRLRCAEWTECAPCASDPSIAWFATPLDVCRALRTWRRVLGVPGTARLLVRLTLGRRAAALAWVSGQPAGFLYVRWGFCRYYRIGPRDAVIGPVFVKPELRGRGIAVCLVSDTVRRLRASRTDAVWIDTSADNAAMRRVIERCGFGAPVSTYARKELPPVS